MRCITCIFLLLIVFANCNNRFLHKNCRLPTLHLDDNAVVNRIAFGSCAIQNQDQPLLDVAVDYDPNLFIYLGDNIYADTDNMYALSADYHLLCKKDEFQRLISNTQVIATWDDHDYGGNDLGAEFEEKEASKKIFLDFWGEPLSSPRWAREGIYTSYMLGPTGKKLQIILLDTRTFRSELLPSIDATHKNDYRPNFDSAATILGNAQWAWLEEELKKPADLRIIASSIQFSLEYNGYESWANFPIERERMTRLIRRTGAQNVFFISGDVHYAEYSKITDQNTTYPIYDFTSSGISFTWGSTEENAHRIGQAFRHNNIGIIDIDWNKRLFRVDIVDNSAKPQRSIQLNFADIE